MMPFCKRDDGGLYINKGFTCHNLDSRLSYKSICKERNAGKLYFICSLGEGAGKKSRK